MISIAILAFAYWRVDVWLNRVVRQPPAPDSHGHQRRVAHSAASRGYTGYTCRGYGVGVVRVTGLKDNGFPIHMWAAAVLSEDEKSADR